ncbi:MAG TPA: strawberry notch family protein, partial [Phenylobacterium sp.]
MNALLPLFTAAGDPADQKAANVLAAARALTPHLNRSRTLDRKLVSGVMTTAFGASDAEGAWLWRDAYDAVEAALVLQVRRLGPQIARLEDAPAEIAALLANLSELGLTHTRRSEEQVAMDQFSTPPELGCLAVLAAQVRPGDQVLEPSAGTGLLAIVAEACGAALTLNERAAGRAALLAGLFPRASRSQHDAVHLPDVLPTSGGFHVVLANPPFQQLEPHLRAALAGLADGGRLAAIVPTRLFDDTAALRALTAHGRVVLRLAFPVRAYAKHGTSVETGLLVIDRGLPDAAMPAMIAAETLADAARAACGVVARPTAQARAFRRVDTVALLAPKARALAAPSGRLAFLAHAMSVAYETCAWSGEGRDVGLYQAYALGRIRFAASTPHPSPLVESGPMASVAPPAPTYRPVLPPDIATRISDAQMETVVYAGEAHAQLLPGSWVLGEAPHQLVLVADDHAGAIRFRKGFFLGDGTGCGKGREIAGVIADNIARGRSRAVWLSKNDALLEDARRDWRAIGGTAADITPQ